MSYPNYKITDAYKSSDILPPPKEEGCFDVCVYCQGMGHKESKCCQKHFLEKDRLCSFCQGKGWVVKYNGQFDR